MPAVPSAAAPTPLARGAGAATTGADGFSKTCTVTVDIAVCDCSACCSASGDSRSDSRWVSAASSGPGFPTVRQEPVTIGRRKAQPGRVVE